MGNSNNGQKAINSRVKDISKYYKYIDLRMGLLVVLGIANVMFLLMIFVLNTPNLGQDKMEAEVEVLGSKNSFIDCEKFIQIYEESLRPNIIDVRLSDELYRVYNTCEREVQKPSGFDIFRK